MTKRDYEELAGVFKREVNEYVQVEAEWKVLRRLAVRMADVFAFNNPRFNRARFMQACGLDHDV